MTLALLLAAVVLGVTAIRPKPARRRDSRARRNDGELAVALFDRLLGAPSWRGWRAFLQSFYGLTMDAEAATLYCSCTSRATLPTRRADRALVLAGRRSGKSRMAAFIGTFCAVGLNYDDVLARGETGVVMITAPSRAQATVILNYIAANLNDTPAFARMVTRRTADTIELRNHNSNIRIAVTTASFKMPRGFTCVAFIGDESAFWEGADSANPDVEILRAILPALATTHGPAIIISTPYSRAGLAFELYDKHFGRDASDTLVWTADTLTMNPTISAAVVDAAFADDAESAAAEFGKGGVISFRNDLVALFDGAALRACVIPGRHELPPQPGIDYVGVDDPAAGGGDGYALGIGHRAPSGRVVVDVLREVRPDGRGTFNPEAIVSEFAALLKKYGVRRVYGDKYAGQWPAAEFLKHGITHEALPMTKSELYLELLAGVNSGAIELLDQARLLGQLAALQRRTGRSGKDAVDHPRGRQHHDDLGNVVAALYVTCVQASGGKVPWPAEFKRCAVMGLVEWAPTCPILGGKGHVPDDPTCIRHCPARRVLVDAYRRYCEQTPIDDQRPVHEFVDCRFRSNAFIDRMWARRAQSWFDAYL